MAAIRGLYLIRGTTAAPALAAPPAPHAARAARADDEAGMPVMTVEFSRFGTWYEIDSWWEGRFLESTAPGAFKRTIANNGSAVKVLFNHGRDSAIGSKALGVPALIEERETSPYMEVPLLDTSYNRDLVPGLEAGAYGSSFMFEVLAEEWNNEPEASDHNPQRLPERTITEVRLMEAGPVTWPANPDATAGLRSGADWLMADLAEHGDEHSVREQQRAYDAFRALHGLRTTSPTRQVPAAPEQGEPATSAPDAPASARHVGELTAAERLRRLNRYGVRNR
ncbi:HK97 family phage prohead protease [Embleya sp. NPDC127516]|uniref:HK97 family phage prohead protease n=1 Tax=Embleya sp. NPDC127516 TaxID=3363990 RepID=UPI00382CA354